MIWAMLSSRKVRADVCGVMLMSGCRQHGR